MNKKINEEVKEEIKNEEVKEAAENTTELMRADEGNFMLDLTERTMCYSSFKPKTREERVAFFNAINSPSERLKQAINKEIKVQHIYAETCTFINPETGDIKNGVRMVFISPDGKSYQAASTGIFNCTKKLFGIVGTPDTWDEPITIIPKLLERGTDKNVLIFELV